MLIVPEIEGVSVVFLGSINPRIFTPDWFARNELTPPEFAEALDIEIIHREVTKLASEGLVIEAVPQRFAIRATTPPFDMIFDLAVRIFGEQLPHTPLHALGINRLVHFKPRGAERVMEIGEKIAPKEPWGEWGQALLNPDTSKYDQKKKDLLKRMKGHAGGVRTIVMEQSIRDDGYSGYIRTKVEPSKEIEAAIFVEVNDHFDLSEDEPENDVSALPMVDVLRENWDASASRSEWIIDQVMAL